MKDNLIYGFHVIERLLETRPEQIITLYLSREAPFIAKAEKAGIKVQIVDKKRLNEWLPTENHQGVAAHIHPISLLSMEDLDKILETLSKDPLLLVLDGIQDPHNLGAILRSEEIFGVTAIIIPKDRAVSLTATVRKVACGAAELVPVVAVTNLARCLTELKTRGIWIVGTAMQAEKTLLETDLKGPIALVLGAEGTGLRRLTESECDFLMKIPMVGAIESLNVSVAAGICLFEALRQRKD